jgi:hypothetical protein
MSQYFKQHPKSGAVFDRMLLKRLGMAEAFSAAAIALRIQLEADAKADDENGSI